MQPLRRLYLNPILLALFIANTAIVVIKAGSLDGTEIVRYRNAFLAEGAQESAFRWTPSEMPNDFIVETTPPLAALLTWVAPLKRQEGVAATSVAIARALSVKPRYGEPIQRPAITTLTKIVTLGTGYCVDYTKVFTALAHAAGMTARQWAFSFDGFGGHGHMFSEVWDPELRQWIMVDVFHGFIPRDAATAAPLSALEFRRRLKDRSETIRWDRITPDHFAFKSDSEALDYYRRGQSEWYLWWGNNAIGYDSDPLVARAAQFGRLPEQISAMITGALPKFKVILDEQNRSAFEQLMRFKHWLIAAAVIEVLLLLALIWNLWRGNRRRRGLLLPGLSQISARE